VSQAEVQLKAALLASLVRGTSGIDVYCRQGVMVLAGLVPSGSSAGQEAVRRARETPGVKRVETFFVSTRPSWTSDLEIKEEIRAKLIPDPSLISGGVDGGVYAGHVMLVGVVSSAEKAQQCAAIAPSVSGVVSVTSFIQTAYGQACWESGGAEADDRLTFGHERAELHRQPCLDRVQWDLHHAPQHR
jgi:osmotically-inducible protein OsmY